MKLEIGVETVDYATPFLKQMAKENQDRIRKALKSAGWWAQREIKKGIRSGAPGGQPYAAFMPPKLRRRLEKAGGNNFWKSKPPLGKLANAVGYEYKNNSVVIGWLSLSAVYLGTKVEKGYTKEITEKMRRFFFKANVPLSNKPIMVIPARPTYGIMRTVLAPQTAGYIEDKLLSYLAKGNPNPVKKNRKYVVVGGS